MQVKIHQSISEIPRDQWNHLVTDNNPLVSHEFLHAMERHDCVGDTFGWLPRHIAVYEEGRLVAAMPLYEKMNSYGEFVFDHAWADAYQRSDMQYYPKLVSAVPYTPANGQRMLCARGEEQTWFPLLLKTATQLCQQDYSGFHCLFPEKQQQEFFSHTDLLIRHDCQYHWFNQGYADFDDFLGKLSSRKRKNIRKERQAVINANVSFRQLNGHTASEQDWTDFTRFYNNTFSEKWGMATFNLGFFKEIAKTLPDNVLLVLADRDGACIAGALMYASDTTLYGRHWGSTEKVDQLHFEACYYQGIDYCIRNHIQCFEPGAQGEHKIARGFIPVITKSAHWLSSSVYHDAIANYCQHEQQAVAEYASQLQEKLPYKHETLR